MFPFYLKGCFWGAIDPLPIIRFSQTKLRRFKGDHTFLIHLKKMTLKGFNMP